MSTKNVIKNSIILYVKMVIQIIISLYTTRIILNALGISDFGIFNLLSSAVAMFGFFRASLSSSTLRFMAHAEGEKNFLKKLRVFNSSVFLHLLLSIIVVVLLEFGLNFFFKNVFNIPIDRINIAKQVSHFIIIIAFLNIITIPFEAVLNARENMLFFSIIDILKSLLILILAFFIEVTKFDKLYVYCFYMMLVTFIVFISYSIYCSVNYMECKINFKKYLDKNCNKEMLSFSSYELFGFSTGMIGSYGTNILINSFFGTIMNAAQGIANQISGQLISFSNTMLKALNPVIVKSQGANDYYMFERSTVLGGKYSFLISAFFAIPFLIETQFILEFWLKNVPDWAVVFCRFQISKNLLEQFVIPYGTAIGAKGNIKKYAITNSLNNIIPLPLIYFLFKINMPPYVMYIVSIFFFSIINAFINMYYVKKLLNFDIKKIVFDVILPCLMVFFIVLLICMVPLNFYEQSFYRFLIVGFTSVILMLFLSYKYVLDEKEKRLIEDECNGLIKKMKRK